jgi:hypothetical protein
MYIIPGNVGHHAKIGTEAAKPLNIFNPVRAVFTY